jgi:uncharacterized protein involved in exopolysaccharide biosynthesis
VSTDQDTGGIGEIFLFVLHRRRFIVRVALAFALAVGTVIFLRDRSWTAGATLLPQSSRVPSGLGGLAAQIGVNLPADAAGRSPEFFAELATSRVILDSVLARQYPSGPNGEVQVSIAEAFDIEDSSPERLRSKTIEVLRKKIRVHPSVRTGTVRLTFTGPDPLFVQAVVQAISERMVAVNINIRQEAAAAERLFAERRLAELEAELHEAEMAEERFSIANRDRESSPSLSAQYQRLVREADRVRQVVGGVRQAFEQARLDQFRDTPPLLLLDPPVAPERPERRGLALGVIAATMIGALFAIAWVIVASRLALLFGTAIATPSASEVLEDTRQDVRRPWRLLSLRR